jgi:phosphohistidine phosphatase
MKHLYLLRHAKTAAGGFFTQDKDRQLTDRGESDTGLIAGHMLDKGLLPDQILCSSAARARATCDRLVADLTANNQVTIQVDFEDELYLAEAATLMAFAKGAQEIGKSQMLIAHNPGMAALAFAMAGQNAPLPPKLTDFPTTALAGFVFECKHWTDLDPTKGRLTHFVTPKDLKSA